MRDECRQALEKYAGECESIAEIGCGDLGASTSGRLFLELNPKQLYIVDFHKPDTDEYFAFLARERGIEYTFQQCDALDADIPVVDLLHLDDKHTGSHVHDELALYSGRVRKYIMIHDVDHLDVQKGVVRFLEKAPDWDIAEITGGINPYTVLRRVSGKAVERKRWRKSPQAQKR